MEELAGGLGRIPLPSHIKTKVNLLEKGGGKGLGTLKRKSPSWSWRRESVGRRFFRPGRADKRMKKLQGGLARMGVPQRAG